MESVNWFSRVGQSVTAADQKSIGEYLVACGRKGYPVRYVYNLDEVRMCIRLRFDPDWFRAEEKYRQQLKHSINSVDYDEFKVTVDPVIERMSDCVLEACERHLAGADIQMLKVASGSAIEVCYLYALESAVNARFLRSFDCKLKVFVSGRWPLTISEDGFNVF